MTAAELGSLSDFQRKVADLQRSVGGAIGTANDAKTRIGLLKRSAQEAPVDNARLVAEAERMEKEINDITNELRGGRENTDIPPPSISERVGYIADRIRLSTVTPSRTQTEQYELANSH